ncbi:GMC family oxidoreductase N-terminal domain-containing protein [Ottowia sp.]|uniref:GMC family oxidoreductase N-terminal domain-containing protein n=1 Tax=Ottowia sp. TaxID=1898956 RepID=UPI003A891586
MKNRITYNGSTLEQDLTLDADVVIVGTGAGGGVTAEILTQAGLKVVMLEKGPYHTAKTFSQNEAEAFPMLYMDSGAQYTKDKGMVVLQGRNVGGGTTVNWTTSFRTPDYTLKFWVDKYGAKSFDEAAMVPHFEAVEKRLNVHKWTEAPPNENNSLLGRGCEKLGFEAEIIRRNVNGCANSGLCGLGCPINAKQGMMVTTIPSALDQGATLVYCAEANQILHDGKRTTGVEALAMDPLGQVPTGKKVRVNAKHVVVSAGAIRSPALLMRSKVPDTSGKTGKRTFLHPVATTVAHMPEVVNGFHGAPHSMYSSHYALHEGKVNGTSRMGYKLEAMPATVMLLASLVNKGFGQASAEMMKTLPYLHIIDALHRDGFNDHEDGGTVEISGDIGVTIDYPLTDFVMKSLVDATVELAEIQFAAGAQTVIPMHLNAEPLKTLDAVREWAKTAPMGVLRLLGGSAHVMGGCQLGTSDSNSVVNEWGRHHAIENLTVIDGSIFPTSIGLNPQLSIYGMAHKNATALAKELTNS